MLQGDIDKNNEKIDEVSRKINRIKKIIRRRKRKNQEYRELSLRLNELMSSQTGIRNTIDALKQKNSHIEEAKDLV